MKPHIESYFKISDQIAITEVRHPESSLRIERHGFEMDALLLEPELMMLWEYLKVPGKVITITQDIALKTLKYLKETN